MSDQKTVMVVDDEELNLKILDDDLEDAGYKVNCFINPVEAWEYLQANHDEVDVILLDRMMPQMNGMKFIELMKENDSTKDIPVIMQTASSQTKEVLEGIEAGVFYYLTKPFASKVMLAIVKAACDDYKNRRYQEDQECDPIKALGLIEESIFKYRTLDEARSLAYLLSHYFPEPNEAVLGLIEILVNAVEHGNLEIDYDDKARLLMEGTFLDEVDRRMQLPEYAELEVLVTLKISDGNVCVTIEDKGKGFDWSNYMEFSAARATKPNGRGIAFANQVSFDRLEYVAPGNKVICSANVSE